MNTPTHSPVHVDVPTATIAGVMERFRSLAPYVPAPGRRFVLAEFITSFAAGNHGSGATHAACFIISLWAGGVKHAPQRWRFDPIAAMGSWDQNHRAAFLAWAMNPTYP